MLTMATPIPTIFTVGHSNHEIGHFVPLLLDHGITAVADVRSQPFSQYTPQFNRGIIDRFLREKGVRYVFMGEELGARRTERPCYVDGTARYDMIARLPAFLSGLDRLRKGVATQRIALMCSEKDPICCHRTILICRNLRNDSINIQHIMEDGRLETQAAAEQRLLDMVGLPSADLFRSRQELIDQAYELQGQTIAYQESQDSDAYQQAV